MYEKLQVDRENIIIYFSVILNKVKSLFLKRIFEGYFRIAYALKNKQDCKNT